MHQDELRKMQAEYEARIANLQKEVLEQSRVEIRARLMAMAGYGPTAERARRCTTEQDQPMPWSRL